MEDDAQRVPPAYQDLPEPLVSRDSSPSPSDPLTPNRMVQNPEPTPLYLDPATGEPRIIYMIPDALVAQCAREGHVEKTRFGTLSELLIVHLVSQH